MTPELGLALLVFLVILLAAASVRLLGRTPRRGGPLPDVPDAPRTAEPIDAPGISAPYSSLDPSAPPKPGSKPTRG